MLLAEIAAASDDVRAATARSAKIARLADCIARLAPEELAAGVAFLSGELRQRQIGAGWAALRDLPPPAADPSLSVLDVDTAFARMAVAAGAGSQGDRRKLLNELFAAATDREQHLLRGLVAGELRQGAQAGVLVDAVARATGAGTADIRRALMLRGDLGMVAEIAHSGGGAGLRELRIEVGRPLLPMLAQTAGDLAGGLERLGPAAIEWKLDGPRVQIHKSPGAVAVFTRTLDDITERVPELVAAAATVAADTAVLDGEAIGLRPDGRPLPFQVTARRIASTRTVAGMADRIPLSLVLFDALHIDGDDLLDHASGDRFAALEAVAPGLIVPRLVEPDPEAAAAFLADALARGHEGVMLKALDQPYESGRRGAGWLKLKPAHTLDLVVLAAEWGHWPAHRLSVEPAPRRAHRRRRIRDARQDLQRSDRSDARLADGAPARARGLA